MSREGLQGGLLVGLEGNSPQGMSEWMEEGSLQRHRTKVSKQKAQPRPRYLANVRLTRAAVARVSNMGAEAGEVEVEDEQGPVEGCV